ncbi:hypothetical protein [Streptomyces sp. NBC_01304]|uniref:hypothetical protein n=1 Tax=Streptomyces sp. NBC_01304 TaxID=2903818 RepID=UPI002E110DA2|nr:hypothetical protein OG430_22055 [Streptomyces sp. NBC_01304]
MLSVAVVACVAVSAAPAPAAVHVSERGEHVAKLRSRVLDRLNDRVESEIGRLRAQGGHGREVRELQARLRHGCAVAEQLHLVVEAAEGS